MGGISNRERFDRLKEKNETIAEESKRLQDEKIPAYYEAETGRKFDPDEESNSVQQAELDSHDEDDSRLGQDIEYKINEIESNYNVTNKITNEDIGELRDLIDEREENMKNNKY